MKPEFVEYAKALGMLEPLLTRIDKLEAVCASLQLGAPEDIFVSEVVQQDGNRNYLTLYFFSPSHVYEIENFVTPSWRIWVAPIDISSINFHSLELDVTHPDHNSRMFIEALWYSPGGMIRLQASRENCAQLMQILKKYLLPAKR